MIPVKLKFNGNGKSKGYEGRTFTIQGVYYSSNSPENKLIVLDQEGDPITHPIPGQLEAKLVTVDPITVTLPIQVASPETTYMAIVYGVSDKKG